MLLNTGLVSCSICEGSYTLECAVHVVMESPSPEVFEEGLDVSLGAVVSLIGWWWAIGYRRVLVIGSQSSSPTCDSVICVGFSLSVPAGDGAVSCGL